ncbi:hypothetical protein KP509_20G004300 [Ceratopteris richardii]|uniref:(6-4)DNA photolyase n=1 Tax=Ceratopteris richardii TaxID=49495 RepID=A0A8T2SFV6_CERRI|nr:hypothetical protein KP509_20G004300 [Ceratopteris richardii]
MNFSAVITTLPLSSQHLRVYCYVVHDQSVSISGARAHTHREKEHTQRKKEREIFCFMDIHSLLWFRKGLRLHDNPALHKACEGAKYVYPVFVLDPWFLAPDLSAPSPGSSRVGVNRIRFLLQSLKDLDHGLQARGSRLLLLKGDPTSIIPELLKKWNIRRLCFEFDTEPYAQARDNKVKEAALKLGVGVFSPISHTIFDPQETIRKNGGTPPLTYQSFCKLIGKAPVPIGDAPSSIPLPEDFNGAKLVDLPSLNDLGYNNLEQEEYTPFPGGESEALTRLEQSLKDKNWVVEFEKPKGDPTAFIKPATTVLSPYLKFGCLSARLFYTRLKEIYSQSKTYTKPPVSLEGQLLWREFFYTASYGTPNFDRMTGNPICKQIPWKDDDHLLDLWREGRTGFPWIDAAMVQLRKWGWMHHLARHAVACFLTRGDLFVYWEKGRDVFDRLLIDSDWAINNGNWMWLSASSFFYQYHRIYSPLTFGKKYDPQGKFVRHFLPVLKDMPSAYIYEPWTAPLEVQRKARCIIGRDYPKPVVDHSVASKQCMEMMKAAYALDKETEGQPSLEDIDALKKKLQGKQLQTKDATAAGQTKRKNEKESSSSSGRSTKQQRKMTDYK